jgi:acyl-homoserine lactone acylase PvdQ
MPFTLSGRTKYLAWGITILYSDGSDIYEEKIKETPEG